MYFLFAFYYYYQNNKFNGSCQKVDLCTGAALKGNCADTTLVCCVPDTNQPNLSDKIITKNMFLKIAGNTTRNSALYGFFAKSMQVAKINDQNKAGN